MKKLVYPLLALLLLFSCQSSKFPTGGAPKEIITPNEINVSKLLIDGEDRTEQLGQVRITDTQWSEHDRKGNVIGVAEIESINNHNISIKWIMAENGANVGDRTVYEYHILSDKVIFTIWYNKEQSGYFEGQLKNRE